MKFYFDTVNDLNLVPPALLVANYRSKDKLSTSKLISEIRSISEIPEDDKQILKDRLDDKFSQKVRNLISHKILEKYNLAILSRNNIELTKYGKVLGKLIKENFSEDTINIKKIIQNEKYQRLLLQAKLKLNFDIFFLTKLVSCDFSQRALGIFKYLKLIYVGDLVSYVTEENLKKVPNAGSKTSTEIKEFLYRNNLSLEMKSDWHSIDNKKSLYQTYLKQISKNFHNNNIDEIICSYLVKYPKENDSMFQRRKKIISLRMSLEGEFATLDKLGKEFNVERERIRQIQNKFCKFLINKEDFKFAFNNLIKFLSKNTPIGEKYLNVKLLNENIFSSFKSLPGLRTIISSLSFTKCKFENYAISNNKYNLESDVLPREEKPLHDEEFFVSSKKEIRELNSIIVESRKLTTKNSFCNFNNLITNLFNTKRYDKFDNIKNSLKKHPNFIWFDDENFMALDTTDQTIIKRLKKLLFIHKKISYENFQASLINDHRIRNSPPVHLIKKICEIKNFKLDNEYIYFDGRKPEFNNLEEKIIKLFSENGGYITFWEGINLAPQYNLKVGSLNAYMYGSYLIKRSEKVFFLAGTEIEQNKFNDAKERAEKERLTNNPNIKIDWTKTKKVKVDFKLTQSILAQGFIYIPLQWHNILEGNYYHFDTKSNISVNEAIWNLKEIISKLKKDTNICLEFSFNPNTIKVINYGN